MDWRQFVMDLGPLNPDMVEEVFSRHGAQCITFTDASDVPVLEPARGETPLWRDTRIAGLFSADVDFRQLRADLKKSLGIDELPPFAEAELADRAWEREWLRDFGPMQFGERLWVCPNDATVDDANAVVVKLDPGLAFGTGSHATTELCLEWLDSLSLHGKTVLDYGCGSGVLAIAALKLGCEYAVATDVDPQALQATADNAARNDVAEHLRTTPYADDIDEQFDVVVANILAAPLIEFAEVIVSRVKSGCSLALSGILCDQIESVLAAYRPWIRFDDPVVRDHGGQTWARLSGRRAVS